MFSNIYLNGIGFAAILSLFMLVSTGSMMAQCQIPADSAAVRVGEYCTVSGKVVAVYQSEKSGVKPVYLNFEKPYPNQVFQVVIFGSNLSNFPEHPKELYEGKKVKVSGVIELYKGRPQIILSDPKFITATPTN